MDAIRVKITRLVDGSYPGWVECKFRDAFDREWTFIEKVPVVTTVDLHADSKYPQEGVVACRIISVRQSSDGREVVTVDTDEPWGVESTTGETRFEVLSRQMTVV